MGKESLAEVNYVCGNGFSEEERPDRNLKITTKQEGAMKGTLEIRLLTGTVLLAAGALAPITQAQPNVLGRRMFIKMDVNRDNRVSKLEYFDFGSAYLEKKGKSCNPDIMQARFAGFDRDGDGFITDSDRTFKSPQELLKQTIQGTWSCENNRNGPVSFVFLADGQADVIQSGASLREKFDGAVSYRFVPSDKAWACLDVIINQGGGHNYYFKCIIAPLSENQIKLRMASGNASVTRPAYFPGNKGKDTIILKRKTPPHVGSQMTLFGTPFPSRRTAGR